MLFLICTAGASAGPSTHFDTELYHAQSIRWIEEYGVVKGLGNLMGNYAYNSAFFSLQALFSMKWLLGRSLRSINGYLNFIMVAYGVLSLKLWNGEWKKSDLFRIILIAVNMVPDNLSSSSTDRATMLLILFVILRWVENIEENSKAEDYAILCMIAVSAMTFKVSAAFLILLAVYPIILFVKKKANTRIVFFTVTAVGLVLPFLVRNVILSGYLLYPFPYVDFFRVDWKIPMANVISDANAISVWGKSLQFEPEAVQNSGIFVWFPIWFGSLGIFIRTLVLISMMELVLGSVYCLWKIRKIGWNETGPWLILHIVNGMCFLYWLFSSPNIRYGKMWVMSSVALAVCMGIEMLSMIWRKYLNITICKVDRRFMILVGGILVTFLTYKNAVMLLHQNHVIQQADYATYPHEELVIDGVSFYTTPGSQEVGYYLFPGSPWLNPEKIHLRVEGNLKEGFHVVD